MKGIDVAKWNGIIDWNKVKADGVSFAILKAIDKTNKKEDAFERNYAGAKSVGLPIDVYNYSYATTIQKAEIDAYSLVEAIKGKIIDRVWLDVEDSLFRTIGNGLIKDIVKTYQNIIEKNGYRFGVYTGLSFYNEHFRGYNSFFDFPFWIARYPISVQMTIDKDPSPDKKPNITNDLWGWQYTSNGKVNGINTKVDISLLYGIQSVGKPNEVVTTETGIQTFNLAKDGEKYISKNFKVKEFRCKDGSQQIIIDTDFVKNYLQKIRDHFGVPVTINSAFRTMSYNKKIGGASNSYHLRGWAFDIVVKGKQPKEVAEYCKRLNIAGIIEYNTFVHVDSRERKYWARNDNGKVTVLL